MKQILIIIIFIGVLVGCRGKSPTETGTYTGIVTLDNDSAFIEVHCECGNHFKIMRRPCDPVVTTWQQVLYESNTLPAVNEIDSGGTLVWVWDSLGPFGPGHYRRSRNANPQEVINPPQH